MEKKYLLNLINQFNAAIGTTDLKELDNSFLDWIKSYEKVLLELKKYYEYINIPIDDNYTFEIGKGQLDSIIIDKTQSISLFNDIKSDIITFDNKPIIVSSAGIKEIIGSNLFYTYNPYTLKDLNIMLKILNTENNVLVSVCGKNYDKDKQQKIKVLTDFFSSHEMNHNYEQSSDNYFYTLFTSSKKLKKNLKL